MHVPVAAAAGATGGAGLWLYSYNRENFQFDAGMRFQRFMAARGFANAQTGQYREDITGLAEMTVTKMDTWQAVCTLFLCVCAALSCAGRLGMHGAAPPGWLCALYSGNIFLGILFCGLALWLAMHASLRAQCAMVSLLTRKVRLPIPSMAQLDQARVFGSSYEKQSVRDMFRIPFMRHPEYAPDIPPASSEDEDEDEAKETCGARGSKEDAGATFDSTARDTVPSWVRDEQVVDKLGGVPAVGGAEEGSGAHDAPEHFKLMAKAMEDWWQYDVYARISMLYGVISFLFAVTYYSIGTTISELRGFWISWSLPMLFLTAQALILRLDILRDNGQKYLPHCEWLGHLAPYLAVAGTTLEFHSWYSPFRVTITWVVVILAFFGHFMMALRMLDLAWPDMERQVDMKERPTKQWWPASWKVPTSFSKALWLLAPPKKLETGQHCLLHEMDDLKRGGASITACRRRRKGAGAKTSAGAGGHGWATPESVLQQCMRIDRGLQRWFDATVWNQVSENTQRQLHSLHSQYQSARIKVNELPEFSAGRDQSDVEHHTSDTDLAELANQLTEVESGLDEVEAKSQVGEARGKDFAETTPFRDFAEKRAPNLPWQVLRVAILTAALQWLYMMIASAVECHLGPESLLKPPGEPPWIRDQKMRGWTPAMVHLSANGTLPDDYALLNPTLARPPIEQHVEASPDTPESEGGHGGHESIGDDAHRRLAAAYSKRPDAALGDLLKVLPSIGRLADAVEGDSGATATPPAWEPADVVTAPPAFMAPALKAKSVSWPPLFDPRHLLCGPQTGSRSAMAAVTTHGFGALVPHVKDSTELVEAQPFALEGVGGHGPIVGAAWANTGLQLVTKAGKILRCAGHAPDDLGVWPCSHDEGMPLPLPESAQLLAAAIQEPAHADSTALPSRLVALLMEGLPETVAFFRDDGSSGEWSPAGEVHLPPDSLTGKGRLGLTFAGDELLITTARGEVHRRHTRDGTSTMHPAPGSSVHREFRAACSLPAGDLMRLALRQAARPNGGLAWGPELLVAGA